MGGAVALSGLAHQLWLAVLLLAVAGAADLVSAVYRQTILQTYAPDEMRGRMQGVFIAVVAGGPRLGDVRAGATAAATTVTVSWVGGGVACAAVVALAGVLVRSLWRYDAHAVALPAAGGEPVGDIACWHGRLGTNRHTHRRGSRRDRIVEVGAALRGYTFAGVDVTVPSPPDVLPTKGNGSVLVPWPNRIRGGRTSFAGMQQQLALTEPTRGNAIHGLGRWARWAVTRQEPARAAGPGRRAADRATRSRCGSRWTYALDPARGLTQSVTARNHGGGPGAVRRGLPPLPVHPRRGAGRRHGAGARRANGCSLDDAGVPVGRAPVAGTPYDLRGGRRLGELRLDDGFTALERGDGRGTAEVRVGGRGRAAVVRRVASDFVQVFTYDDLGGRGPGVALEPMSCASDAFNSGDGLVVLDPGATWTGHWGIAPL